MGKDAESRGHGDKEGGGVIVLLGRRFQLLRGERVGATQDRGPRPVMKHL